MIPKDVEPAMALDIPQISKKTPNQELQKWSSQRWPSDGTKKVAGDIVNNVVELLEDKGINIELVLKNYKVDRPGSGVYSGKDAIAASAARTIGGFTAAAGWSMHDPAIVYLSVKCLADKVKGGDELEHSKNTMRQAAVAYGKRVFFPDADLYIGILDLFLKLPNKNKHRNNINKVGSLLAKGDIKEAYRQMMPLGDLVRRRGEDSSSNTTSSILTPQKPGM